MAGLYPNVDALAQLLDAARSAKGLSYNALGRSAGVDPGQANRICRGRFRRLDQSVLQICTVLGVTPPGEQQLPPLPSDAAAQKITRELMAAWDQTPEGADRLAQVLRAMREYRGVQER